MIFIVENSIICMMTNEQKTTLNNYTNGVELVDAIDSDGNVIIEKKPLSEVLSMIKEEYSKNGESSIGVSAVHVWLARSKGADNDPIFILQERSDNKRLDKTIGGHISSGLTPDQTVEMEASEEMGGVSLKIVAALGKKALEGVNLGREAVAVQIGVDPWQISGRHDRAGDYYEKPTRTYSYVGLYDGDLETIESDFEVNYFVEMPYSQIQTEIQEYPDRFTPDLKNLIDGIADRVMHRDDR